MIKIVKFPSTSKSLCEVIEMLSMYSFQIVMNWQFNKGELNVTIVCQEEIESFIASWLSVNCFLYHYEDVAYDDTVNMNKQYNWIPKASSDVNSLDETNLLLLLIGLKKSSDGIFTIRLESNGNIVRVAVSYRGATVPSGELISALGQRYCVKPGYITCFFDYKMNRDRLLLTLPYVTKTSTALIQGFGNKMQAKMKTDLNKNTDIVIGTVLNDPLHQILCLTLENFRSSTYVFGAPGYGKTTLLQSVLYQTFKKQRIPFLVIEPKREYRSLRLLIPEMIVIKSLYGLNPLIPPRGVNVYDYVEVVLELLNLAEEMPVESPLPVYIREVYYRIVMEKNFNMENFIKMYIKVMDEKKFNGLASNFIISGKNRLENFFRIFAGPNFGQAHFPGFDVSRYLQQPTVIEIGKVATPKIVTVLTYFVTAHVKMYLEAVRESDNNIKNILCLEEAHVLLSPHLNENLRFTLANLLAEGRAKGLTVVVCDQTPSRLDSRVCNLCGNAVTFRLTSQVDKEYVQSQLECEIDDINSLRPATAIIRTNTMYQSEVIHINVPEEILHLRALSDEELKQIGQDRR